MKKIIPFLSVGLIGICNIYSQTHRWDSIKANTHPVVAFPLEYGTPYKQPLSVAGWEDGIYITRDGLNLYCTYLPIDFISWQVHGGSSVINFSPYAKGPDYGMDFSVNISGVDYDFLQTDVLYSHRNSTADPFTTWQLSATASEIYSEGGVTIVMKNNSKADIFVYATNEGSANPAKSDILWFRDTTLNPTGKGIALPYPVKTDSSEDNPHMERMDANNLVLFFESKDRPGGVGQEDVWFSTSADDGVNWTTPISATTVNTIGLEAQPHLYYDQTSGKWFLYFTGLNPIDSKISIFRAEQTIPGNWNSWGPRELVIGPGNAWGVGEPTLTDDGGISFILVYEDQGGTLTDKYDADAWFLPQNNPTAILSQSKKKQVNFFPNPCRSEFVVQYEVDAPQQLVLNVYSSLGQKVKAVEKNISTPGIHTLTLDMSDCAPGIYYLNINSAIENVNTLIFRAD